MEGKALPKEVNTFKGAELIPSTNKLKRKSSNGAFCFLNGIFVFYPGAL